MDKIIVYVDDAEYALQQLAPMEGGQVGQRQSIHWIVVACPPRITRYVSRWVNHAAREKWRSRWSARLLSQILPDLQSHGDSVTPVLARGALIGLTEQLMHEHGVCRVMDARRPKFGQDLAPVTAGQPASDEARWMVPGAVLGIGAILVLAGE